MAKERTRGLHDRIKYKNIKGKQLGDSNER